MPDHTECIAGTAHFTVLRFTRLILKSKGKMDAPDNAIKADY